MPVLSRPEERVTLTLPPRQASLAGSCDVLVVGGGPAGIGAALGATAAGAKTVLVERYGFLGGNATAALVMPLMSFYTEHPRREQLGAHTLLPTDHGPGDPVIAGAVRTFLARLVERGGALAPSIETGFTVPFDPEQFKLTALELLDEAGVQFLFHAFASGIVGEGRCEGVVFETKAGPQIIRARMIVDATGDGDIAAAAGAPYEVGRETDGLVQPMTLVFRMADFERAAFEQYIRTHPNQWRGVHGLWDLIARATAAGELELPREDILFFATPHPHEVSVNSTRVTQALPLLGNDPFDISHAEWVSRRQMRQIVAFLRKYVPGFEQAYLVQSGVQIGVRETRRIRGDYRLTDKDVLAARKFDDVVARSTYPIDVHNPAGTGTILKRLPPGEAYDIPLRCLLPQGLDNVLTAGRCISGSAEAHSSYRVMPVCMAVGQAAGACAALAALKDTKPRQLALADVQRELLRQGANLRGVTS
jgi:glycine/D-amino acid oxidase-like deaminating enzyme